MTEFLIAVIAFAAGGVIAWLIQESRTKAAHATSQAAELLPSGEGKRA